MCSAAGSRAQSGAYLKPLGHNTILKKKKRKKEKGEEGVP